jgi:aryl-alcohol dehydrogenase-like predicted oxidoreductase
MEKDQMKYARLNYTDLEVSTLCLGTGPFGTSVSKEQAFQQMDEFVALGGNFIDTAHVYGDWGPGEKALSEKIIGEWMDIRGCRKNVVISTKGGHPLLETMDISRVNVKELEIDLCASLDALRTDAIDIYFLHRDNPEVPVADLIEWLEMQKHKGKIRHYGCSNWSLQRMAEAQQYARSKGHDGLICNQIQDSLADSNHELMARTQMVVADKSFDLYHRQSGMNFMAYMAVAHGYFSKMEANVPLSATVKKAYDLAQNVKMLELMKTMKPYSVNDFSYQYILQRPYPSIPISSFSKLEQMRESIESCCKDMPRELIDKVSALKLGEM